MYLTEVLMGPAFCHRHRITDDYGVHKVVYSLFPLESSPGRFLYADTGVKNGERRLLILSETLPEVPEGLQTSARIISERFFAAERYRFQVLLNPVKCLAGSKKLEPVLGQLPLLNYFMERTAKWGFEADPATLEVRTLPSSEFKKGGNACRFHRVEYRGMLRVMDRELFRKTFASGIGRGKAFGFGLLQLVPIQLG